MTPHRLRTCLLVPVVAALAFLLAGCSGGSSDAGTTAEPASDQAAHAPALDPATATEQQAADQQAKDNTGGDGATRGAASQAYSATDTASGKTASSALAADSLTTQRVRTADLTVRVKDLSVATAKVRAAAVRFGGAVSSEKTAGGAPGGDAAQSVMVVRVPEPDLDDALAAVAATGTELSRISSDEDVTAVLADLTSRESSQRASVERVRALMAKATSLQDIVLLESELSRRETDLEAAQASRRALADQAAMATISVNLTTGTGDPVAGPDDDEGFLAGLRGSWHAVQKSTTVLLTVLGAILPVALGLAVLGWPAYLVVRRLRPGRPVNAPATPVSGTP